MVGVKRKRVDYDDSLEHDDDDYGHKDEDDDDSEDELIERRRKGKRRPAKKGAKHKHKHEHNHYDSNGNNHQESGNVATIGKKDHTKLLMGLGGRIATAIGAFALGNTSGQLQSQQQQNMYGMAGNGFVGLSQFIPQICPFGMIVC